jgi:hypothetical protein
VKYEKRLVYFGRASVTASCDFLSKQNLIKELIFGILEGNGRHNSFWNIGRKWTP